jgi:hypothetical protein
MITRTITFADVESRPTRQLSVSAETTEQLMRLSGEAMATRLSSEAFVFTSTSGGNVAAARERGESLRWEIKKRRELPGFQIEGGIDVSASERPALREVRKAEARSKHGGIVRVPPFSSGLPG